MATDLCGSSFSTLPGKELVCSQRRGHRGPCQAYGVTWAKLFPDPPMAPDLHQAIQAATEALQAHASDPLVCNYPVWATANKLARITVGAAWKVWTGEA